MLDFGRRQGHIPLGGWPKFLGERVANGYSVGRGRQALANEKVEIILEGRKEGGSAVQCVPVYNKLLPIVNGQYYADKLMCYAFLT